MDKKNLCLFLAATITVGMVSSAWADVIEIEAVGDIWIGERFEDSTHENDMVGVWSSHSADHSADGGRRCGLLEFDLSTLKGQYVSEVYLGLFSGTHNYSDYNVPIKQHAYVINCSTGTALISLTWNSYMVEKDSTKVALETLGAYDLPVASEDPAQQDKYVYSVGSSADVAKVRAAIDNDGKFCIVLAADEEDAADYRQSWGDIGWYKSNTNTPRPAILKLRTTGWKAYNYDGTVDEEFGYARLPETDVTVMIACGLGYCCLIAYLRKKKHAGTIKSEEVISV